MPGYVPVTVPLHQLDLKVAAQQQNDLRLDAIGLERLLPPPRLHVGFGVIQRKYNDEDFLR
jgi:hypothetical protein